MYYYNYKKKNIYIYKLIYINIYIYVLGTWVDGSTFWLQIKIKGFDFSKFL